LKFIPDWDSGFDVSISSLALSQASNGAVELSGDCTGEHSLYTIHKLKVSFQIIFLIHIFLNKNNLSGDYLGRSLWIKTYGGYKEKNKATLQIALFMQSFSSVMQKLCCQLNALFCRIYLAHWVKIF
jgi:hypothetical protein